MTKTAAEIIEMLGGLTKTAKFFGVKPASVFTWRKDGFITDLRLIESAARLEAHTNGRFNRRDQWPETYAAIWPELADYAL